MESTDPQILIAWARDAVLVALLLMTSWTDTRTSHIYNRHTFPAMACGVVLSGLLNGQEGVVTSLLGLGAAFLIMFPLFGANVMRAGDAKLLMAIGALTGAGVAVRTLLTACFVFVPVAIVVLVARGRLGGVWEALKRLWRFFYTSLHPLLKAEPLGTGDALMMPFGLVLSIAAVIAWKTSFLAIDLTGG